MDYIKKTAHFLNLCVIFKNYPYLCPFINIKKTYLMSKKLLTTVLVLATVFNMYAGGLLTNTNQNVTFLRNPARDASTEIDAAYTNPAGLAFLKGDKKWYFSLNNQSAFQTRTINSTFGVPSMAPFAGFGDNAVKEFEGKAKALVIPNLQAAYKTKDWVFSANIGIVGGGGTMDFSKGLPSFESQVAMIPLLLSSNGIPTNKYSLESQLKGTQIIYGIQLGATYKFNENLSAYLGARASIVESSYKGFIHDIQANVGGGNLVNVNQYFTAAAQQAQVTASSLQPIIDNGAGSYTLNQLVAAGQLTQAVVDQMSSGLGLDAGNLTVVKAQDAFTQKATMATGVANQTADKDLDCKQSGFGVAPIIGFNYNWNSLNIGVKYEFKTGMSLKNKTATNTTGVEDYNDGVKTPYDIPALLAVGAKYDIIQPLTVSVGYHHFFDSDAKMAHDKQQFINGGVNEYLAGIEYRINKMFLISCGTQFTRQGVQDNYQSDMSFSLNSYSLGFGGAINVTENVRINLAYFFTNYSNWTKDSDNYNNTSMPGTDIYGRTNKTFGIGVDFSF